MNHNTNLKTGVAYGYISSQALDPEVVHELLYGVSAVDLSFLEAEQLADEQANAEAAERGFDQGCHDWEDYIEGRVAELMDGYECSEPEIEGEYEGVHYRSSWLGGALNLWIFESPCTTDKARRASPCVPGAGILDTLDGSVTCYDVPAGWRAEPC